MSGAALPIRAYRAWRRRAMPVPFLTRRFIARAGGLSDVRGGLALDVGAGVAPYRAPLLEKLQLRRCLAAERAPSDTTDLVCDARRLPLPDACVDAVVSFEALQHVDDPQRALDEMVRVLRPGGVLLLGFPFVYAECDVADHGRWSLRGMREELARRGVELLAEERRGGSCFALASLFAWALQHALPGGRRSWRAGRDRASWLREAALAVLTLPAVALQWLGLAADALLPKSGLYAGAFVLGRVRRSVP